MRTEDIAFDHAGLCRFRKVAYALGKDGVAVVCSTISREETDQSLLTCQFGFSRAGEVELIRVDWGLLKRQAWLHIFSQCDLEGLLCRLEISNSHCVQGERNGTVMFIHGCGER